MDKNRPNILFAIADDASHMSAYGHKFLNTPAFDRVAGEGILFTNAFTTNPKCAPSRASILTGMHTWQLEDACNHYGIFPSKFTVYPDILQKEGYHIGYTGKGWAPGDWERGGFIRNPAGPEYNEKKLTPPSVTCISEIDYFSNFENFLSQKPDGAPFYFWYGGFEPHRNYVEGEGLRAGKKLDTVDLPVYFPDNDIVRSDILDYAYEIEWFDLHLGKMLQKLEETGELENTLVVVTSDNGMPFPRVKGQMYEQDFNLPMAVRWKEVTSPGRIVNDLVSFIDLAPTFLEVAGIKPHLQMEGRSLLDIIKSGKSGLGDETRQYVVMGKERHDVGREGDIGYPVRCIRTREYLYIINLKPELWPAGNPETGFTNCDSSPTKSLILKLNESGELSYFDFAFGKRPHEELYNIINDPECMKNLAVDSEYKQIVENLSKQLIDILINTNDPQFTNNGDVFDTYEYTGDKRHSWKAYKEGWFVKQGY
ncbi:MAG: heparan N-sulfatase [Clostridiales bacterium GWC2_40_7]|nr:MAG: heparan N-sulfatase [Clostridiales bacterium GWC2_40_7]